MVKKILLWFTILLAAAAAVLFLALSRADLETLELDDVARSTAPGQFVELSDGLTHYGEAGPASQHTVILVHGFSVPYYIWDTTFTELEAAGFRVLRFDTYGRGFSDRPDVVYNGDLFERQIGDLISELELPIPVDIVGLSMGGAVAARFVANNPDLVRRLVLIDPTHKIYPPPPYPQFIGEPVMALTRFPHMADGQMSDFLYPENYPTWVDQYRAQMQYKGFRRAITSTLYHFMTEEHLWDYARIQEAGIPVQLIWGKQDQTLDIAGAADIQSVLDVDFMPVDEAGHLPHIEQAALVNPAIVAFLQGE